MIQGGVDCGFTRPGFRGADGVVCARAGRLHDFHDQQPARHARVACLPDGRVFLAVSDGGKPCETMPSAGRSDNVYCFVLAEVHERVAGGGRPQSSLAYQPKGHGRTGGQVIL